MSRESVTRVLLSGQRKLYLEKVSTKSKYTDEKNQCQKQISFSDPPNHESIVKMYETEELPAYVLRRNQTLPNS